MNNQIEIGCKVVCPVTDEDGELSHKIGLLNDINKRYATVEFADGEIIKVGKSKIELMPEAKKPAKAKTHRASSGRKSVDNGDNIALMLRGKSLDEVYTISSDILKIPEQQLRAKYNHLNAGQQRMCLGNRLRKS